MNRYPVWKYIIILITLLVGVIYTLPNFFGEAPAVQVSPAKSVVKVDPSVQDKVKAALAAAQLSPDMTTVEAMEFLEKQMNMTASNEEFLATMNQ